MAKKKKDSQFKVFISNLVDWNTVKRVLWYAGSQALVTGVAVLSGYISSIAEPTTATVIVGLLLAQVTKAISDTQTK
jgi:hypothetical protein